MTEYLGSLGAAEKLPLVKELGDYKVSVISQPPFSYTLSSLLTPLHHITHPNKKPMPISIHPLTTPTSIPTIISIISTTFAHNAPIVDALYPHHDLPHGRASAIASLTKEFESKPNARFLMAVDEETGEVVGQANWLIVTAGEGRKGKGKGEEGLGEGVWDNGEEREWAEWLYRGLVRQREGFIGEVCGRGERCLGSQLIKWGTDLADSMGIDTVLEATKAGIPVYEKHGFETEFQMRFEVPEKFEGRERPELAFMRRKKG
ncbi:MAG: hypothetical protein Q9192_005725, partial [Flavoplaca navasiana]